MATILSKTALVVATSVLLMAPLTANVWAKEGRSKGGRSQNNSRSERVEKSPRQERIRQSAPSAPVRRENTKVGAPEVSVTDSDSRKESPIARGQNTLPKSNRSDIAAVRSQPVDSSPPLSRQAPETKPKRGTITIRNFIQILKTPSDVQVKPPKDKEPVKAPDVIIRGRDTKPDVADSTVVSQEQVAGRKDKSESRDRDRIRPDKTDRIATPIEAPKPELKPNPESKERVSARPDKTRGIAVPIESPKADLKPDREQKQNPGKDFDETFRKPRPKPRPEPESEPDDLTLRKWDIQSRHQKIGRAPKTDFIRSPRSTISFDKGDRDFFEFRSAFTEKVAYEDRSHIGKRKFNYDHVFRDRHNRLVSRIIWPGYHFPVYYKWGHHDRFHYVYPFYHRRYIFVSLGGFWPDYTCLRYYWYPAHDFWWYGYYPVAQEVGGDTYNCYTYNYYGQPCATTTDYNEGAAGIRPVDSNTFSDVREKLSKEQKGPDAETPADVLFDEGVKSFEQGLFAQAVEKFEKAITLAPDDMILPFAYSQALLADGRYAKAAEVLRLALMKSSPEKEGVYFPRGLYLDENTLMNQIDLLTGKAENNPSDSDLQLLLGYQLLGVGEVEKSLEPLRKAKEDPKNSAAANTLLVLAEKIQAGETQ